MMVRNADFKKKERRETNKRRGVNGKNIIRIKDMQMRCNLFDCM